MIPTDAAMLTHDELAHILRVASIDEPLTSAVRLAGGYSKVIYEINDRYILRISHYIRDGNDIQRERTNLQVIQGLPGIPQVLGTGTIDLDDGLPYLLVSKIPGVNVFRAWLDATPEIQGAYARGLVEHLRPIHAIPWPSYSIGYHRSALRDWTGAWLDGHDAYMASVLNQVRQHPFDDEVSGLIDAAERYYAIHRQALTYSVGPRFIHGDIQLYNVIAAGGQVTGIIDWEWAHGGEPDFDLADLVRWSLFPAHPAEEELEAVVSAATYSRLVPTLLDAYPEVAATPRLRERMTIYEIEYDLHMLIYWPRSPGQMRQRLTAWLREGALAH